MKLLILTCSILISSILSADTNDTKILNLNEAIDIALKNNNSLKISQTSIQIAQAMYQQAMSANYPSLDLKVSALRMDEDPTYTMVGTTTVDNSQMKMTYSSLSKAAAADGNSITAATYSTLASLTPSSVDIPINSEIKLMDRDSVISLLSMEYPLYVGGKISAITKQASLAKKIAIEGKKRAINQIIYDVKRYYYAVVLTKQLKQLSSDTIARMEFLSELTSKLYNNGSMNVKKTDYLRSKLSVSLIKSLHEQIVQKELMAKSALLFAMGLAWKTDIDVKDNHFEKPIMSENMISLVEDAYKFNPDYTTLKLAIEIKKAQVEEAKSDYLPHIGLLASAQNIYNSYEYGMVNEANTNSWTIGIGATWSLFNGMRTTNKVEQSRLEKIKLQQTQILLQEGLALGIKQAFLEMKSAYNQYSILKNAVAVAQENRELNTRAYQEDMVETKDVIESQLFESYTQGDFYRSQYEHIVARAKLDYIVGLAIEKSKR